MSTPQLSSSPAPTAAAAGLLFDRPRQGAHVEVIVKRRRFSLRNDQATNGDAGQQTTHSPRTYRVAKLRLDAQEERSQAGTPSAEAASQDDGFVPGLTRLGKRKRRVLNGRVTIIRPTLESETGPIEPVRTADAQQAGRDVHSDLGPFGMRKAAERRYARLLKAIERLQVRAAAARKAEAEAAVRWIRRTMARYDIRACEVAA